MLSEQLEVESLQVWGGLIKIWDLLNFRFLMEMPTQSKTHETEKAGDDSMIYGGENRSVLEVK